MTTQYGATIMTPVAAEQCKPLQALLLEIGDDVENNTHVPFSKLTLVHFMSWFLVKHDDFGPYLFLELNVDGPIEEFLRELIARAGPGLDLIYGHCEGYPAGGSQR